MSQINYSKLLVGFEVFSLHRKYTPLCGELLPLASFVVAKVCLRG